VFSGASWEIKWALTCAKAHPPGGFLEWMIKTYWNRTEQAHISDILSAKWELQHRLPRPHRSYPHNVVRHLEVLGIVWKLRQHQISELSHDDMPWQDSRAEPGGNRLGWAKDMWPNSTQNLRIWFQTSYRNHHRSTIIEGFRGVREHLLGW